MIDPTRNPSGRRVGRSVLANLAGLVMNKMLSTTADQIFHFTGVYPPCGVPIEETRDDMRALSLCSMPSAIGGFIVAGLAPHWPVPHAAVLGMIGTAPSLLGLMLVIQVPVGPTWCPALLAAFAPPSTWLERRLLPGRRLDSDVAHRVASRISYSRKSIL